MTKEQYNGLINSRIDGIELTKEQAIQALEQVITIKGNEVILDFTPNESKEFCPYDARYEYLALKMAINALKKS